MSGSTSRGFRSSRAGKLTVAVAILLLATVVLLGTATAVGVLGVPRVVDIHSHLVGANDSTTVVDSNLTVDNPNPFPITLRRADVSYTVFMNDVAVGDGREPGVSLPAGNSSIQVTTGLRNDRIDEWWVSHIRHDERTNLTVVATVQSTRFDESVSRRVAHRTVRTDIISAFETNRTIPIDANRQLVSDPVLYVNQSTAHWGTVTQNRTVVRTNLTVYNPHSYAIPVTGVDYNVTMNGVRMANGSTENVHTVPAHAHRNVTARLVIDNDNLDEWWVRHVQRNQTTTVRFDYAVDLDLAAFGGGNRTVSPAPINRTFRTDVFGRRGNHTTLKFT